VGDIFQTNQSFTEKLASSGGEFLLTLFFGCLLSATVFATITYFVSYRLSSSTPSPATNKVESFNIAVILMVR
jgi:uncharacterized protein (DUF2062 family)